MFVRLKNKPYSEWGIGRLEEVENDMGTIVFFDSPVTDLKSIDVPTDYIQRVRLGAETRVYWEDISDSVWRVGRLLHDDGEDAHVRFPNGKESYLPLSDIYVRWDFPIGNPAAYLAKKINETPIFAQARSKFVRLMTKQKAASQEHSALISSIIDLEPHQVDVIRRILQDPRQRYLLADEVGLGKTIEAGVVIRQYVLDDPKHHNVVIVVPLALVKQWTEEISARFLLGPYLDISVHIVPSDHPINDLKVLISESGLLVIDEAHHLTRDEQLFGVLKDVITMVPRLLLLSATPVLHNELCFLRMLHLLDPIVYSLSSVENFRTRIENRQFLAETVAALVPENLLQMEYLLEDLSKSFPSDRLLDSHIEGLNEVLLDFPEESDSNYLECLYALRSHLSEGYRLDRRILRNRRRNVIGLTPSRNGVYFYEYSSAEERRLTIALEKWRMHVASQLYGNENSVRASTQSQWFASVISQSLDNAEGLAETISGKLEELSKLDSNDDIAEIQFLLEVREAMSEVASNDQRYEVLEELIEERGSTDEKFVIFASCSRVADRIYEHLSKTNIGPVDRHSEEYEVGDSSWHNFLISPNHRFLICDQKAEEGLNLQGRNQTIVHFDLPMNPNRVEQRIGRVDRYGSGSSISSVVIRCPDNVFEMKWTEFLDTGLSVFTQSIASLQYVIEEEIVGLQSELLLEGTDSILRLSDKLGHDDGLVATELRRIDKQDSLDSLSVLDEDYLDDLFEIDSDWRSISDDIVGWLSNTLLMDKVDGPNVGQIPDSIFRLRLNYGGRGSPTLLPLSKFLEHFIGTLDIEARGSSSKTPLTYPYSCRRETALRSASMLNKVRLLRLGEPFLEGLDLLTALDDRGRSVAMWRQVSGHSSSGIADVYIRFDFIVEADVDEVSVLYADDKDDAGRLARPALKRRVSSVFPPFFQTIWLDEDLRKVEEAEILKVLSEPYNKSANGERYRDFNLNPKRWGDLSEYDLPVVEHWEEWILRARERGENVLREHTNLGQVSNHSVEKAREYDSKRFAQLRTRIDRADKEEKMVQENLFNLEARVADGLYAGIYKPRILLDTITAVFISALGPKKVTTTITDGG